MGIGGCVLTFALGAILTFGVDWQLSGVNLQVVGLVLMAAGLLGLGCYVTVLRRRRLPGGRIPAETVIEDRRYYDAP
ncbi:hypothetical protein [Kitasatospora sp. NPDC057015]|uniref:hypothetical protein n=1 Tax=Kitasatospora sp. NPDC057015 TaxID=3346001 RepID=UPI00362B681F